MTDIEQLQYENENLKKGNVKVWEQLEKSTEILSHHEAYISLLEEENEKLKEQYNRSKWWLKEIVENHRFTPISTAEKALKELEELDK